MPWTRVLAHAADAMAAAPPYGLVEALEAALRQTDDGARVVVRLADYRLEELRAVGGTLADPVRIEGTGPGRVFATQRAARAVSDPTTVLVPITVRGDRLGVLTVTAPVLAARDSAPSRLSSLGTLLGQALMAAEQVTDVYRMSRRAGTLTLAAEMQWDKLPGRSLDTGYATVAAQLEPAHQVVGDAYDWVSDPWGLSAVLVDGSGYGTQAAGNTVFTISAVRNARREGADLAGTARLADQALYARHGGSLVAAAALLDLDPETLDLRLVSAGAAVVLVAGRSAVRRLVLDRQPPLGAEEDYPYTAQTVRLRPGDRIVVASDGLADARVDRRSFGDRLERIVQGYRLLGAAELVRAVVRDLLSFHAGTPLQDDAVILCLDVPPP